MKGRLAFPLLMAAMSACGVASVSPVVTDADVVDEPALAGGWRDDKDKDEVAITAEGPGRFRLRHVEKDGKAGEYHARLGRLGPHRVLDLQPVEPLPAASDNYRSLLLRAHGMLFVGHVGDSLPIRMIVAESLAAHLKRHPRAVAHTVIGKTVLLTGSSGDSRRFIAAFVQRPGVLGPWEAFVRVPR
jgi:hypothetical protein